MISNIIALCIFVSCFVTIKTDTPCAARQISGQSVVCVCNATYCDDFTRDEPEQGSYKIYTSSKSGLRFNKSEGTLGESKLCLLCSNTFEIQPDKTHQEIQGFGGSVTDAAGINWMSLDSTIRDYLIKSYYSSKGLDYNFVRVPIGGCDFSTRAYAYNELPVNDVNLSNYTLSPEDYEYKIPMIQAINAASSVPVNILGTTWSPPVWMKTNNAYTGISRLKAEYYQTYADYHIKFIEEYAAENITIWGITTTNEPLNGVLGVIPFNCLGWTASELGSWITKYLGPTVRNSTFKDIKILTGDDQRYSVPLYFNVLLAKYPEALEYIDGVGVHYYANAIVPAEILDISIDQYPGKFIMGTEACAGFLPTDIKVLLGSWDRANSYIKAILQDLNHEVSGWIDWNLCLDTTGGPNWASNFVDSAVIVNATAQEFYKQPMYYALGHVSKFVPKGSVRIEVSESKGLLQSSIPNAAFLTPRNTTVLVLANTGGNRKVKVKRSDDSMVLDLIANSIVTVEFNN
ncbi:unnamed protein product [Colias eurytheme]|nr:unnamed protein product [Colias eurytheme]